MLAACNTKHKTPQVSLQKSNALFVEGQVILGATSYLNSKN